MLRQILSISGRKGLYKLIKQGRGMLIVESLLDGKRTPAYASDRIVSLGDIAMYTHEEDVPLTTVLTTLKNKNEGKALDMSAFNDDADIRNYFGEILPDYDEEHVYTSDIRKLFSWYNILINAGISEFEEKKEDGEENKEEKTDE